MMFDQDSKVRFLQQDSSFVFEKEFWNTGGISASVK
jgi:hypothetical protein